MSFFFWWRFKGTTSGPAPRVPLRLVFRREALQIAHVAAQQLAPAFLRREVLSVAHLLSEQVGLAAFRRETLTQPYATGESGA